MVEVSEQVVESEKVQPEAVSEPEVIAEPESIVEEAPAPVVEPEVTPEPVAIEREELPLPEEVKAREVSPEEWQAEAETVEIVDAAEEQAAQEEITDEELEAQALAAEAVEEAVMVVTRQKKISRLKKSLRNRKTNQRRFLRAPEAQPVKTKENLGSGFISLFRGKKSTMICLKSWKNSF